MTGQDDFLTKITKELPDLCSVADLVKVGIYHSHQAAYAARMANNSPPHFKIGNKNVVYPKDELIEWLKAQNSSRKTQKGRANLHGSPGISHDCGKKDIFPLGVGGYIRTPSAKIKRKKFNRGVGA